MRQSSGMSPECLDILSGDPKEAKDGRVPNIASHSCHRLGLVLRVGASRMCCCAWRSVTRPVTARAGRRVWSADGVAANDPSLGVRPP